MTTRRAKMVDAFKLCARVYSEGVVKPHAGDVKAAVSAQEFFRVTGSMLDTAAATITRDGELRERLAAYAFELETSGDPEEADTKRDIGAALKALLEETSSELWQERKVPRRRS